MKTIKLSILGTFLGLSLGSTPAISETIEAWTITTPEGGEHFQSPLPVKHSDLLVPTTGGGQVIYVNAKNIGSDTQDGMTWDTAFAHLGEALDHAQIGDQVWVAEGFYTPLRSGSTSPREDYFSIGFGVKVYGGFKGRETALSNRAGSRERTILSGEIQGDDIITNNSFRVVVHNTSGGIFLPSSTIDGFTIQDGFNPAGNGAGLFSGPLDLADGADGSKLDIQNTVFRRNTAKRGGGAYLFLTSGNIDDSRFEQNFALQNGGALYISMYAGSRRRIANSDFIGNQAMESGGAIARVGGYSSFSEHILMNSRFIGNAAPIGGAIYYNSRGADNVPRKKWILGNVLLARNSADEGSALFVSSGAYASSTGGTAYIASSKVEARNVSVVDNYGGPSLFMRRSDEAPFLDGHLWLKNSIAWGNSGESIEGSADLLVGITDSESYIDVLNLVENRDPEFRDRERLDYRLKPNSSARVRGAWELLPLNLLLPLGDPDSYRPYPFDLDGNPRESFEGNYFDTAELGAFGAIDFSGELKRRAGF